MRRLVITRHDLPIDIPSSQFEKVLAGIQVSRTSPVQVLQLEEWHPLNHCFSNQFFGRFPPSQFTEPSPKLTIDNLPDEVLLDIFDFYRPSQRFSELWREECLWFNLAHVCRRWRAVMLESASRLDLAATLGPKKPGNIETILSSPWPFFINYRCKHVYASDSALCRMRSALEHHDRVRGIVLNGSNKWFDDFFEATNSSRPFPVLESLFLRNRDGELKVSDAFFGNLPDLRLRSLELYRVSLAPISGLLSSAKSLTNLFLEIYRPFSPSAGMSLLASLQGMPCLCDLALDLFTPSGPPHSQSQLLIPKDVALLSKLTSFSYAGSNVFLNALVAGISAPSLRKARIDFRDEIRFPIPHLPRFVNEIEERYHAIHVCVWKVWSSYLSFSLSLQTLEYDFWKRVLEFETGPNPNSFPDSMMRMSDALSMRLTTVEALEVSFGHDTDDYAWEEYLPWRRFYRHFPSVKTLKIPHCMARTLYQDNGEPDDLAFLPALEQIDLGQEPSESQRESQLVAFQPFVSARLQAGRPVKVLWPVPVDG